MVLVSRCGQQNAGGLNNKIKNDNGEAKSRSGKLGADLLGKMVLILQTHLNLARQ